MELRGVVAECKIVRVIEIQSVGKGRGGSVEEAG